MYDLDYDDMETIERDVEIWERIIKDPKYSAEQKQYAQEQLLKFLQWVDSITEED